MMNSSSGADAVPCGSSSAGPRHNDNVASLQSSDHPSIAGSSATISGQSPDTDATSGQYLQDNNTSSDSVNERSQILKSPSDSDESNESGSLPSKSSSTIDSSSSIEKGKRLASKTSNRVKTSKRKKDRTKLRKGKWTLEEEEYTSRIIHYFSTGLLTLPEGATLRSYLADKLNCDPMRITKKYAGASCLGRRVYHFRDRVHPTIAEIQVAKAELDHLEQRFRLRIEGGHPTTATSSIEIPPQAPNTTSGVVPAVFQNPQNLLQTMLLGLSALQQQSTPLQQPPSAVPVPSNPIAPSLFPQPATTAPVVPTALAQIFLANGSSGANPFGTIPSTDPFSGVPQIPGVDPMITNWALSQVAAALGPALSQLTSGNMPSLQVPQTQQQQHQQHQQLQQAHAQQLQLQQQQQLQAQQQQQAQNLLAQQKAELQNRIQEQQTIVNQKLFRLLNQEADDSRTKSEQNNAQPAEEIKAQPVTVAKDDHSNFFAAQFKQAYDRHLNSLGIEVNSNTAQIESKAVCTGIEESSQKEQITPPSGNDCASNPDEPPRTDEDKEGGTALLGFLSSLRKSYENVLRDKQMSLGDESVYMSNRPATVTDSNSSQQRDSSVEDSDWNSDKKTDNSSSEDSEKEESRNTKGKSSNVYHNQGPPRKRMKVKRVADAIRKGPSTSKLPE